MFWLAMTSLLSAIVITHAVPMASLMQLAMAQPATSPSTPLLQPQRQSQTGSDGNVTATINGNNFKAGDTIRINGTIAYKGLDPNAAVAIGVSDPDNRTVENATVYPYPATGAFTHKFVAGIVRQFDPDGIMRESGNYTVRISYTPPYIYGQESPTDQVNFTFAYKALGE
jgi:hypothetical protein